MSPKSSARPAARDAVQLRLAVETPEQTYARVFRELKPRTATPVFDVRYCRFSSLRANIRFEEEPGRILVNLSDLLRDAPPEAQDGLATVLLCKLYGKPIPRRARQAYDRWVGSPATEQKIFAITRERKRKQMLPPAGLVHDLDAFFDDLNGQYFAGKLRKPALGWSVRPSRRRLGHYDQAHDAIVISRIFDDHSVPELALEYVLFHEMLHLKHPVRRRGSRRHVHTPEFLADERRFDGYDEARCMLLNL